MGDSMETCCLKLLLLSHVLTWATNVPSVLPISPGMQITNYNSQVSTGVNNVGIDYNASPIFGEACLDAGGQVVFPFDGEAHAGGGGVGGAFFVHVDERTVPSNELDCAIAIPRSFLDSQEDPHKAYALILIALTMWPLGFHRASWNTTNLAVLNAGAQFGTPVGENVFIPGRTRFHLIIPVKDTGPNPPPDQVTARGRSLYPVITGPTVIPVLATPAFTEIAYATVGALNNGIRLSEFLYSWLEDCASITYKDCDDMAMQLALMSGRGKDLVSAKQMCDALSCRLARPFDVPFTVPDQNLDFAEVARYDMTFHAYDITVWPVDFGDGVTFNQSTNGYFFHTQEVSFDYFNKCLTD